MISTDAVVNIALPHAKRAARRRRASIDERAARIAAAVLTADPREAARRLRLRLKKRRQRAARYAAGLTASGKPVLDQGRADRRRVYAPHPAGCLCFDCLFPPDTERRPLVARFVTPYRRGDRR